MFVPTKKKKILLALLTVLVLAFIWGNSCMNADSSGAVSDGLGAWLARIFGEVSINIIRKLAHFTEFASLGFLLIWQHKLWAGKALSSPILFGLLAALIDETIQLFSPGRAAQVRDLWIDFAGFLAGTLALLLLHAIVRRKKK